jgi:glycosyltransferase involved in cell wall biosynthesis
VDKSLSPTRTVAVNGVFLGQPLTGVQRYARELVAAVARLAGDRLRLVVIAPAGAGLPPEPVPGVEILLERSRLPRPLWVQLRLPALARRIGARLLWSPSNTGPLAVREQLLTVFDGSVFAHPEWFSRSFGLYHRSLLPRLGRRARRVLTISEFSREELVRHRVAPREKIEVVGCGVSPAFRPDAERGEWAAKRPYLLTVGSRDPRKNVGSLLKAFALLPPALRRDLRLLVAGGRSPLFAGEGMGEVPPGVELLGFVPDRALPGLYAGAEAFIYPSLYEGFGLPPLEAMACGTPVAVSSAPCLPETCGEAALYFDPLDPPGMAARIEKILSDSSLRERLRAAGLARAARFTWERAAQRMISALEEALGQA